MHRCMKLFKVNEKDSTRVAVTLFWYLYCYFEKNSHPVLIFNKFCVRVYPTLIKRTEDVHLTPWTFMNVLHV